MNHIVLMSFPEQSVKSVEGAEVVSAEVGLSGFGRVSSGVRDGTPTDNAAATGGNSQAEASKSRKHARRRVIGRMLPSVR